MKGSLGIKPVCKIDCANFGQAKAKLNSTDASQRLAAVDILENNLAELDVTMVKQLYLNEKNDQVKARLAQLKARLDFNSNDEFTKLEAVKVLADSNRPDVFALINQTLEQPQSNPALKAALLDAHNQIKTRLQISEWSGHVFSGLSTASILLLAALGLAITYGLLGVINMAHGEFLTIGAYTTFFISTLTESFFPQLLPYYFLIAIIAAFLTAGIIGYMVERLMISRLYQRPLDTLLATWGLSLIMQQLFRSIFGPKEVSPTLPDWLMGSYQPTEAIDIPINGLFLVGVTLCVTAFVYFLIYRSRWGLQLRATNQNRFMSGAVGINTKRVDSLTFALGCGLAGIAGAAFTTIGSTGPTAGSLYIVDTFLVVVFGGAASLLGTVASAFSIAQAQSILEFFLSGSVAKVLTLATVIIILMLRPQGLFSIKVRK